MQVGDSRHKMVWLVSEWRSRDILFTGKAQRVHSPGQCGRTLPSPAFPAIRQHPGLVSPQVPSLRTTSLCAAAATAPGLCHTRALSYIVRVDTRIDVVCTSASGHGLAVN
jgi:hypothetical protein